MLNGIQGLHHFYDSLLGFVLGVAIFFIPFAMGWVGAGDVKYLGVVGSLLGFQWLPRVLFYSALAGGVLAIAVLVYNRISLNMSNFVSDAWFDLKLAALSLGRILPGSVNARASRGSHVVPLGAAIGVGTVLAYYIDPRGTWAGF